MTVQILSGDCRSVLSSLPAESVHCCVTSPPYWGLRDYGVSGQIGLEKTPEAYVEELVAVFREVRRVLRGDGTVWLNLGDSYAGSWGNQGRKEERGTQRPINGPMLQRLRAKEEHDISCDMGEDCSCGHAATAIYPDRMTKTGSWVNDHETLKPKDLVGIPWMVAKALQSPYYTGKIRSETERAWLAGFLDGEGTISFVERDRGPDHTPTHDARVYVTNTDREPLDYFATISGGHVYVHDDGTRENRFGTKPCYRWQTGTHDGALLLRELYPYLRTKRRQASLIWTLYTTLRHKNGHARTPDAIVARRREIADMVRSLNAGGDPALPPWVEEPPPPTEPGWYLRSDIIWHKPNPMPESVTDRPTKAHEYLFLLAKGARYWYDAEAIREPDSGQDHPRAVLDGQPSLAPPGQMPHRGIRTAEGRNGDGRNRRSVWTVATQPFSGAHFATFPPALIEPCILAGCPEGGTVLDPFGGAGTTGLVADRLGRNAVLVELNPEYAEMARRRIEGDAPLLVQIPP